MWELLEIEELTDGRVWAKWRTVADDGLPLVEGAFFTPETDDIEEEIVLWLTDRQVTRERINAAPKVALSPKKSRLKRSTARLDATARQRLTQRLQR